jgi:transposase
MEEMKSIQRIMSSALGALPELRSDSVSEAASASAKGPGLARFFKEVQILYDAGPEAVARLILGLVLIVHQQDAEIQALKARVKALEDRLGRNSGNSHNPPSTDRFVKPKSLRKKSDRPAGGQEGHPGRTLKMVDTPDHVKVHPVSVCEGCGTSLEDVEPTIGDERRQVFDLPPVMIEVTEHRVETKTCSHCGFENKAPFPNGVDQPVQYGPGVRALVVYLKNAQFLSYERIGQMFDEFCGQEPSPGTLVNMNQECCEKLEALEERISRELVDSPTLNCDETSSKVDGERHWLHVAATNTLTRFMIHPKRGKEATDEMDILPRFEGVAVHDAWSPYFGYECEHALCNAHHLRELTAVEEEHKQAWATDMKDLLLEIKETVEGKRPFADSLDPAEIEGFEARYRAIVAMGLAENPPKEKSPGKRGKAKQSKSRNLLLRLEKRERETLAFMCNFKVPFDNNQAERDIRMMKLHGKTSGGFRSQGGAKIFCRIRSYISTARKNGTPALDALKAAFEGKPYFPEARPP